MELMFMTNISWAGIAQVIMKITQGCGRFSQYAALSEVSYRDEQTPAMKMFASSIVDWEQGTLSRARVLPPRPIKGDEI